MIDYSIIIPQKNSLKTLPRLFDSIPNDSKIEVIICDNSEIPISKDVININRDYKLVHADPKRYAGGARNEGLKVATGKWLLFADADDFYTPEAFSLFDKYVNSDYDLVYFKMGGVYEDTMEPSDRGKLYSEKIDAYMKGVITERYLKVHFDTPTCKMIKKTLVEQHEIKFDEVIAGNDSYFSMLVGFYSEKFTANNGTVYIATTGRGSLTRRRNINVTESRYFVRLRKNKFLREHGMGDLQSSVMVHLVESAHYGIKTFMRFLKNAIKYRQNIFLGYKNWIKTYRYTKKRKTKEKNLITE